ncbi:MAG: hypothetical protein HYZ29_19610 [Myxococcales bacterium]|nr:hypothetical protein [Myxococcales bacterium]
MRVRAVLLCAVSGLALGAGGCTHGSCTEMGCLDTGTIAGESTKPSGPVAVELCFNGACQTAKTDAAPNPGSCVPVMTGMIVASVCFHSDSSVTGQLNLENATLADGDHYELTISDAQTGNALGAADQTVKYATAYPNGRDCPGSCKVATLKVTPP